MKNATHLILILIAILLFGTGFLVGKNTSSQPKKDTLEKENSINDEKDQPISPDQSFFLGVGEYWPIGDKSTNISKFECTVNGFFIPQKNLLIFTEKSFNAARVNWQVLELVLLEKNEHFERYKSQLTSDGAPVEVEIAPHRFGMGYMKITYSRGAFHLYKPTPIYLGR